MSLSVIKNLACSIIVLIFSTGSFSQIWAPNVSPRVLVLNSYHPDFIWTQEEMRGINSVFANKSLLVVEYMDSKRFPYDKMEDHLEKILKTKYQNFKFDIIITTDYNALLFANKFQKSIFHNAPIVFCGVEIWAFDKKLWGKHSGIFEDNDWKHTIKLIKKVLPNVSKIVLIADPLSTDVLTLHSEFLQKAVRENQIPYELFTVTDHTKPLEDFLLRQPKNTVILASILENNLAKEWQNREGTSQTLASFPDLPVFTTQTSILNEGGLGGVVKSGYSQGREAALLAMKVLSGKIKEPIRLDSPKQVVFNYPLLDKYNINKDLLPKDTTFINMPDSRDAKTKSLKYLSIALSILLALAGLFLIFNWLRKRRIYSILKESEDRFVELVDNAPVMIGVADENSFATYFNTTMLKFCGQDVRDILGLGWKKIVHPDDVLGLQNMLNSAIKTQTAFEYEFRMLYKDGSFRWVICQVVPKFDLGKKFCGYIGSCIDINDRKTAETQLLENERKLLSLKEAADMANQAKSQFLASVTHELRTPLTAILGYSEILDHEVALGSTSQQMKTRTQTIHRNAKILLGLVNDLLDLSRIEAGGLDVKKQDVCLREILEETATSLMPTAVKKGLRLNYKTADDIPDTIFTDPLRLKQIIINLVDNAIKFSDKGQIDIVTLLENSSSLVIYVNDQGVGISQEHLGKLFKAFSQVEESYKNKSSGTGLGLYLIKRLIHAMGGKIELVESQPGKGSSFKITLTHCVQKTGVKNFYSQIFTRKPSTEPFSLHQ